MRNNESGEFELVLGNRQLISGFFIVVILFGIFFAMGYIVGRNSAPSPRMQAEMSNPNLPNIPDTRPQAAGGAPLNPQTPPENAKPSETPAGTTPEPATQPATQAAKAEGAQAETVKPADGASAAAPVSEPPAGTYLQVMAVRQAEAEIVLRTLKDKGFPASLGPGPNSLVRVLVGPYQDTPSLGKAKADLENAGFHPIVKR
jgi:cell division septation protein DedD